MFGEGASVLAVPEPKRAENSQQTRASQADEKRAAITPEQLQRRAQSRGLWTNSDEVPVAPTAQSRSGTLPRAVVGTPNPAAAANTNYRSPAIGSSDSQPAQALPLVAAEAQPSAQAQPPADIDAHTLSVHPDFAKEPSLAAPEGMDGDTIELPAELLRGKQPEPARPTGRVAQHSAPNTTVWLALILIAAVVAVWFIGAAIGFWSLPWGKSTSGRTLNKAIPAKSLPEMHAAAPQEPSPAPVLPSAAAPSAPDTTLAGNTPQPPAAPEQATAVMEAEEAAPLRAPAISVSTVDDLMDPPAPEVAPTLTEARTELRAGRPKEAEALLRPLLEKYPDDHHIAEALAQALLARGAAVEAVGFAQRIVKKQPKRASYRVLLGDALRRAGDEPSAKLAYKDALALDPKLREAQRRLKNRKLVGTP